MCIRDRALADRPAPATNRDGSRPCCMRRVRPRDRNAQAGQSQHQAAQADQSTDSCALKAKSLEQGLTKMPARQKRAADESAKTRRIRRSLSLRLRAVQPSDFRQHQVVWCCAVQAASQRIGMAICSEVIYSQGGVVLVIRIGDLPVGCLLYTSPSPRDQRGSRMPSSA